MAANVLAGFEFVMRAAIRALGFTGAGNVQIHLGVAVPQFHVCRRIGAKHTAMTVEVFGLEFDRVAHAQTFVNQCAYLGLRPLTMSKNAF